MVKHRPTEPSQSWRTFLANHISETAACDFFVVPTVTFHRLFCFVVMSLDRRRILHINVTKYPTAEWTAQQLVDATRGEGLRRNHLDPYTRWPSPSLLAVRVVAATRSRAALSKARCLPRAHMPPGHRLQCARFTAQESPYGVFGRDSRVSAPARGRPRRRPG